MIPKMKPPGSNEERITVSLEEIVKKLSHIEDWMGELVTYLKRK